MSRDTRRALLALGLMFVSSFGIAAFGLGVLHFVWALG